MSRRHERMILQRGGREHAPETYPWIVTLHAAWLAAMLVEVFAGKRKFHPRLALLAFGVFSVGQALRLIAIRTLGWRWSTRIMSAPEETLVRHGIYRFIRHPNYLGVGLEVLSAPLVHSAYVTSAVFSVANALLLRASDSEGGRSVGRVVDYSKDAAIFFNMSWSTFNCMVECLKLN
ncbi:MAG: isoprenylcysteine carboxylmethyltransferase family protein [Anaerolineales bacterium]